MVHYKFDGTKATSFEEIAEVGTSHFKDLFQEECQTTIDAIPSGC
jgi:hypothetical protein